MLEDGLQLEGQEYLPLRDVVFRTLRDAILRGEIQPGERLMEIHLADKLGVSRTPVREAIHMLELEGLAITIPHRGAQVAKMTAKDLEDVLEVRDALDALAVKKACYTMTEEDFSKLYETMDNFKEAVAREDLKQIVIADEDFHNVIYESVQNPKLTTMIMNLKEQMYRYRFEYIKGSMDHSELVEEHDKIAQALKEKDADKAQSYMHEHLANQVNAVKSFIANQV